MREGSKAAAGIESAPCRSPSHSPWATSAQALLVPVPLTGTLTVSVLILLSLSFPLVPLLTLALSFSPPPLLHLPSSIRLAFLHSLSLMHLACFSVVGLGLSYSLVIIGT